MAIEWTTDLATGSAEIDHQHKTIFFRINEMLEACKQGKGKAKVESLLRFLEDYTLSHFGEEERFMLKHSYPDYGAHKALHEEFKSRLAELKKKVETEGVGVHTVIATNQLVVNWFINHIRKVDTKLGAFWTANSK
jgi:hemerythrin